MGALSLEFFFRTCQARKKSRSSELIYLDTDRFNSVVYSAPGIIVVTTSTCKYLLPGTLWYVGTGRHRTGVRVPYFYSNQRQRAVRTHYRPNQTSPLLFSPPTRSAQGLSHWVLYRMHRRWGTGVCLVGAIPKDLLLPRDPCPWIGGDMHA